MVSSYILILYIFLFFLFKLALGKFPPQKRRKANEKQTQMTVPGDLPVPVKVVAKAKAQNISVIPEKPIDMAHTIGEKIKITLRSLQLTPIECLEIDADISELIVNYCNKKDQK